MSRCFPFPPQGYVKKSRADDMDLLKKEKYKEKKHKKERRDKEKRDGKERKEKDRTEGKHRDKKDKKDRHKDKRKDRDKEEKEREGEKDRGGTSEERRLSEQKTDGRNSKEGIINKDRPPEQIPGKSGQMDKEKGRTHIPDVLRVDGLTVGNSTGSAPKSLEKNRRFRENQNNHAVQGKFVPELGKRVRDEARFTTQSSEKITLIDQRKDDSMVRQLNAAPGPSPDKKERSHTKRVDDCRLSGQGVKDEIKTVTSKNSSTVLVPFSEGMPRPPRTSIEEKMAGREKIRDKERKHAGAEELVLLDSRRSKTPINDKGRDREERKAENTKMVENRVYEEEKLRERTKDSLDAAAVNGIVLHVIGELNNIYPSAGNDKKRKDLEPNGFLHENELWKIKLPKQSPLLHPSLLENGRIEDVPGSANQRLPGKHGKLDVVKADKPKEHKPNGIIEKKPEHILSSLDAASLELLLEKEIAGSPHPDLKHLDKVLTVPKFEELVPSEDNQEWLFGTQDELQKPRKTSSADETKEAPQWVWSEAVPLESADIVALPYVVPF